MPRADRAGEGLERDTDPSLADTSVVILCHDRVDEIDRSLPPRLDDVRVYGLELIVVDNGSLDGTRERLEAIRDREGGFTLLLSDRNLGVGAGRNLGWRHATRPVIITLDEDVRASTQQLVALKTALQSDERTGIVHPIPINPTTGRAQIRVQEPPYRATNFHGCCYAVRRELLDRVGEHDPLCDFGGEELDLSIRARADGWEVLQIPDLTVEHNSIARVGRVALWRRRRWMQNHARVLWRAFPARWALPWSALMLAGELRAAVRRRRPHEGLALAAAWARGVREGRGARQPVPPAVIRFYADRLGVRGLLARRTGRRA